jgi:hypothetical protein
MWQDALLSQQPVHGPAAGTEHGLAAPCGAENTLSLRSTLRLPQAGQLAVAFSLLER